ncbi:MAG: GEVED domain-containing protein, partial [Planctomycetaceae bacterium]
VTINSAGSINGAGLVTATTIDVNAVTGIGNTIALELAATSLSADTTNGNIDLDNTNTAAATFTSLTTGTGTITVDNDGTGGGSASFTTVTTTNGAIDLESLAGNLTVGTSVTAGGTANVKLTTTTSGNVILTGTTTATGDTITITSAGNISGAGQVTAATVNLNATTGIILTGNVAPGGNVPGLLVVTGNVEFDGESTLLIELTGTTPGTEHDQVQVTGTLTLSGSTLSIDDTGFTAIGGELITLIDNDGTDAVSGTFADLPEGSVLMLGGLPLVLSYQGGDGNDVVLIGSGDYGDAPDSSVTSVTPSGYPTLLADGGAFHVVASAFRLGALIDDEQTGQPSADATGDGDDEDGVSGLATIVRSATVDTRSSFEVFAALDDRDGRLQGWIDFNRDGDWNDEGEQIVTNHALVEGSNVISFVVPVGTEVGTTFARLRLSETADLGPTGFGGTGEVEDYAVTIVQSGESTVAEVNTPDGGGELTIEMVGGSIIVRRGEEVLLDTPVAELESLTINGSDETDDTLMLDFSEGSPIPTGGLFFNGGDGGNDLIMVTGDDVVETATYTFETQNDGTIEYDFGDETLLIDYTGLEPVIDNMQAVNRIFDFTGGSEMIELLDSNGADGMMRITSTLGESIEFINPTGSLTINGGDGDDTITITSLDAAFALLIDINGGDGDDIIVLADGLVVGDVTGGADTDLLDLSAFTTSVTINLATGTATNTSSIATLENVTSGSGNDVLTGNSSNNVLTGNSGNDTISGGSGTDMLFGGADDDRVVESVTGNSTLTPTSLTGKLGGGTDTLESFEFAVLTGSAGNDSINAATFGGDVTLSGGAGKDSLTGGGGDDRLDGGIGNDTLKSGAGNDLLSGGEGTDSIDGGTGIDCLIETITGNITITNTKITGLGADKIVNVECFEFTGDDRSNLLDASKYTLGSVVLRGLGGNDTLLGGSQNDVLDGGAGIDLVRQSSRTNQAFSSATNVASGAGNDLWTSIELLHFIGTGNTATTLDASQFLGKVTLDGGSGNDMLFGGTNNNELNGNAGHDSLIGGNRNDVLRGGAGNDTLRGNGSDDQLFGDAGNDRLFGGDGQDLLSGGAGGDTLLGEVGHDTLLGGEGNDGLRGGEGNDILRGNAGTDTLVGDAGNDVLETTGGGNDSALGGTGDDTIIGDASDRVSGGAGKNIFVGKGFRIDEAFTFDFDKLLV